MKIEVCVGLMISVLIAGAATAEPAQYEMDPDHTIVQFTWNHNRLSNMSGRFMKYDGDFNLDFERPSKSRVEFTIDAESIWTGVEALDNDMKSSRLFDVAEHSEIKFTSTRARKTGLERGQLMGELTIKGITKPVTLFIDVNYQGPHIFADSVEKYKGAKMVGMTISARVNRTDFDLSMAVPWIADEIDIRIESELVAYPEGQP
jgi:polyisoprenoid-binding protein YceI